MRHVVTAILVLVGVVHLLPLVGVLGAPRLFELYGVTAPDRDTEILLRHRAALFGLLGGFLVFAAFSRSYQVAGFVAGMFSVTSFLLVALSGGPYNAQLSRIVAVDLVALVVLVGGAVVLLASKRAA